MPEGHTIHRLARRHNELLAGRAVRASSPQGRFAAGAAVLDGRTLDRVEPYGKHLFYRFGPDVLHVHLGLYGTFEDGPCPPPEPRGALRLRLETGEHWVDLRGPTACELLTEERVAAIRARLGPDPLRRDADPEAAWRKVSRRDAPVGAVLLDQSVLAGVGNVYRAEVLFARGIHPERPARTLAREEFDALWATVKAMLRDGVSRGRIVTTRPADRDRRGNPVAREDAHYVYRRTGLPCRRCGTDVVAAPLAGRTSYWCPSCQPPAWIEGRPAVGPSLDSRCLPGQAPAVSGERAVEDQ